MAKITNRKLLEQQIMFYENNLSKLTDEDFEELYKLKAQLEKSKRGKSAKVKGASYERTIAKLFKKYLGIDLVRTPQSGGFAKKSTKADEFRGDITSLDDNIIFGLHLECKNQKTLKMRDWLKQSQEDCPQGKIPCVIFHQNQENKNGKRVCEAEDYITLKVEDFLQIVNAEKIIVNKETE